MKKQNVLLLIALWAALTAFVWFSPAQDISEAERRPLAQMPEISPSAIFSGSFMKDFESYSLDQFPLRDAFRTVKSLFHTGILGARDNNGIYITDGYAVKQEYPLNQSSLDHASRRFQYLHEKYLTDAASIHLAIIPDKGHYLAHSSGHLTLDHAAMADHFQATIPWASQIDLTAALNADAYYRTDTHWRQEALIPAAQTIAEALGVTPPQREDFTQTPLSQNFYGVYYGQAALPLDPDPLFLLENEVLNNCAVYDYETGKTGNVYDLEKLTGKDPYEIYLSGPKSLMTIVNPAAKTDRELVIFRDSFASAIVPLLLADYAKITLVDIRYVQIDMLDRFLEIDDQEILLLYSTLVLNNSSTIK